MDNKKDTVLEGTGHCVSHKPDDKYVKNMESTKKLFDDAHAETVAD
tara:strand:- start:443 stop:580 length:138 start_codon:yes stop_codon:yes gene_type:complete